MEVILIKDLKRKGTFGDVIEVADGYARNFLIPNGYALFANRANRKRFAEIKDKELAKVNNLREQLKSTADQVKDKTFTMIALSRDGKLYGSITSSTIVDKIKEEFPDIGINGSDILIEDGHIKFVGTYSCKAQFTKEIYSNFTVVIEADESDEQPELLEALMEDEPQASSEEDLEDSEDTDSVEDTEAVDDTEAVEETEAVDETEAVEETEAVDEPTVEVSEETATEVVDDATSDDEETTKVTD